MTVEANTVAFSYVGNGASIEFPFPSKFLGVDDILVYFDGVAQISGFQALGARTEAGGRVRFTTAPPSGTVITLVRDPAISQLTQFEEGSATFGETLETGLDRLTMILQALRRRIDGPVLALPNYLTPIRETSGVTLYVPEQYDTEAEALDSLKGKWLDRTTRVDIILGAGNFTRSTSTTVRHPQADRIFVSGAATRVVNYTVTNVVSLGASKWSVTATLSDATGSGLLAGDLIEVISSAGPNTHEVHRGAWELLTVAGSTAIWTTVAYGGAPPNGVTGTVRIYPTQVSCTAGASGILCDRLGGLANIAFKGDGSNSDYGTFGILASDLFGMQPGAACIGPNLLFAGFGTEGVRSHYAGQIHATGVTASNNGNNGFMSRAGSYLTGFGCVSSGNGFLLVGGGGNGFLNQLSSGGYGYGCTAFGNYGCGFLARNSGSFLSDNDGPCYAVGNRVDGFSAETSAYLQAAVVSSKYNGRDGFRAEKGGVVLANLSFALGNVAGSGYNAIQGGVIQAETGNATSNGLNGFMSDSGSFLTCEGAYSNANGFHAFSAINGSYMMAVSSNAAGVPGGGFAYFEDVTSGINHFLAAGAASTNNKYPSAADDAAAAAAGVQVNGLYRNGSVLMTRTV